jgi:hypothetical protein
MATDQSSSARSGVIPLADDLVHNVRRHDLGDFGWRPMFSC